MTKKRASAGPNITSEQIRAARALLRIEQRDLAMASGVSLPTIKRLEIIPGPLLANAKERTIAAMRAALERAGIEFTDDEHQGVHLIKRRNDSPSRPF